MVASFRRWKGQTSDRSIPRTGSTQLFTQRQSHRVSSLPGRDVSHLEPPVQTAPACIRLRADMAMTLSRNSHRTARRSLFPPIAPSKAAATFGSSSSGQLERRTSAPDEVRSRQAGSGGSGYGAVRRAGAEQFRGGTFVRFPSGFRPVNSAKMGDLEGSGGT